MTSSTRLTGEELRRFHSVIAPFPFRLQVVTHGPIRDVAGVLSWLDRYRVVVEREVGKLRETDLARARAVTVLNGLRREAENLVDTIRQIDEQIAAGELPTHPTRVTADDTTDRYPYVGEGADGARRSAQIDREEVDGLDRDDPRREQLLESARSWDRQAERLERAAGPLELVPSLSACATYGGPEGCQNPAHRGHMVDGRGLLVRH